MFKRPLTGTLDDRPIGEWIAEGNSQLNHARTRVDGSEDDLACSGKIGIAAGYVGDERGLVFKVKGHEGPLEISHKERFVGAPGLRIPMRFAIDICLYNCISLCYCDS